MTGEWLAGLIASFARGLTGATVQWVNCQPHARQRVYFANHTSHLDFVVLWAVLPRELRSLVRPVAAKDYWSSGLRKALAVNIFHAVLIERRARQSAAKPGEQHQAAEPSTLQERTAWERIAMERTLVERTPVERTPVERTPVERTPAEPSLMEHAMDNLLDALGEKNSLIIFPEGTRGNGDVIAPFKSGIYHLWRHRPDVEFVPVYLANLNRVLPKGEFLPVPIISRVIFGPPLQLEPHEAKESFINKAHQAVSTLGEL